MPQTEKKIHKILVANRGEIALRIIRAAHKLKIHAVAVFADDDRNSWYVHEADEAYPLEGKTLSKTYLNGPLLIRVAKMAGCDAIHPGYGFLSENALFAELVEKNDLKFIGPDADIIRLMGDKIKARNWVKSLNIPVIPAVTGQSIDLLISEAAKISFPVLVKAALGGGGKGMQIVHDQKQLKTALMVATREAQAYFGDSSVFVEQYIPDSRHIEVQVLADNHGQIAILGDRECSLQRRYQKVIEEAPAPGISDQLKSHLAKAAKTIAHQSGYRNAGTVEFLVDKEEKFYFLEMNTRLQVEHPVTEETTGVDIVQEQIRIASGLPLPVHVLHPKISGHAVEARVYAENPGNGFLPAPGKIHYFHAPSGRNVRIESSVKQDTVIQPHYDPLVCKIITSGPDRLTAIRNLQNSLQAMVLHGIESNLEFLQNLIGTKAYMRNRISTAFIRSESENLIEKNQLNNNDYLMFAAAFLLYTLYGRKPDENILSPAGIWKSTGYWRLYPGFSITVDNITKPFTFKASTSTSLTVFPENSDPLKLLINELGKNRILFHLNDHPVKADISLDQNRTGWITIEGITKRATRSDYLQVTKPRRVSPTRNGNEIISAPMTGKVIDVKVTESDHVHKGQPLVTIEAMKMQNTLVSPDEGKVKNIWVKKGNLIQGNEPVIEIEHKNAELR